MALALVEVAPTGRGRVYTLHGDFDQLEYPPASPQARAFRQLRKELRFTLITASEVLGIRVTEVSDLEHGAKTCDWVEAERMLRAAVKAEK